MKISEESVEKKKISYFKKGGDTGAVVVHATGVRDSVPVSADDEDFVFFGAP